MTLRLWCQLGFIQMLFSWDVCTDLMLQLARCHGALFFPSRISVAWPSSGWTSLRLGSSSSSDRQPENHFDFKSKGIDEHLDAKMAIDSFWSLSESCTIFCQAWQLRASIMFSGTRLLQASHWTLLEESHHSKRKHETWSNLQFPATTNERPPRCNS